MNINYFKIIFKITSLIVLSTNIAACSELQNERVSQPEINQSETALTATNSVRIQVEVEEKKQFM